MEDCKPELLLNSMGLLHFVHTLLCAIFISFGSSSYSVSLAYFIRAVFN